MALSTLWKAPEINPKTRKAKSIPFLNVTNVYARCFHLSWLAFLVCFLSWFAFPPLMSTIAKDLKLTAKDTANNNIAGLSATLIARVILGPLCDKIGPRYAMVMVLLVGSIPTAFVPLVTNVSGLHAIRFFVGLLGGSFIPCQMWTTVFFDKDIVGRANAFAGGWGNAGGGIAFFMMPAIMEDLSRRGYSLHRSWSLAFVVGPLIILWFVAGLILLFGSDSPEGKWSNRTDVLGIGVDVTKVEILSVKSNDPDTQELYTQLSRTQEETEKESSSFKGGVQTIDAKIGEIVDIEQIIEDPSFASFLKTTFNYRTMLTALPYLTTFGGELAIEAVLSALYVQRSKGTWTAVEAGRWGSMMGLLNVVTRPFGGWVSDLLYARFSSTKAKKFWMIFCGFFQGVFLLWIGLTMNKIPVGGLIGALAVMCIFMEMGNGANFSLVPHINPHHTGIVAGTTGAFGNIGGIVFSLVIRFTVKNNVTEHDRSFWIIGLICMAVNAVVVFLPVREDRPYGYLEPAEKEKV